MVLWAQSTTEDYIRANYKRTRTLKSIFVGKSHTVLMFYNRTRTLKLCAVFRQRCFLFLKHRRTELFKNGQLFTNADVWKKRLIKTQTVQVWSDVINVVCRSSQECTFGGVYVPCIYSHARWSYRRLFRSLSLRPLSVDRYCFPLIVEVCKARKN